MVAKNCVIDFYRQRSRKEDNEGRLDGAQLELASATPLADETRDLEMSEVLKALARLKEELLK